MRTRGTRALHWSSAIGSMLLPACVPAFIDTHGCSSPTLQHKLKCNHHADRRACARSHPLYVSHIGIVWLHCTRLIESLSPPRPRSPLPTVSRARPPRRLCHQGTLVQRQCILHALHLRWPWTFGLQDMGVRCPHPSPFSLSLEHNPKSTAHARAYWWHSAGAGAGGGALRWACGAKTTTLRRGEVTRECLGGQVADAALRP
jgi:hypothetical protein